MKRIVFSLLALFAVVSAYAKDVSENEVPSVVRQYVEKNYPDATSARWEYKNRDDKFFYYKVEFEVASRGIELELSEAGELLLAEEEMTLADVPGFVKTAIRENYPGAVILGAKKGYEDSAWTYDVGIRYKSSHKDTHHQNVYFDMEGNIVRD